MPYSLTRQEMFDLLWSTPRAAVLGKLGITEVQLGLICGFHRIPRPTKAYWAQKEKGEEPRRPALPPIADPWRELVTDRPRRFEDMPLVLQGVAPEPIAESEEQAPMPVPVAKQAPIPKSAPAPRQQSARTQRTALWSRVRRPHQAIAESVELLRAAKPVDGVVRSGGGNALDLRVGRNSVERAIFVLDGLARALEKRGVGVRVREGAFDISKERQGLRFRLHEKFQDVPYQPTEADRRRQAVVERQRRTPPYPWLEDAFPSSVKVPLGTLKLTVDPGPQPDRQRQNWQDNKYATLEAQIDSIAGSLDEWLDYLCEGERAEARKVRIEMRAQENRRLADARAERERQRSNFLAQVTERALTADKIRTWIAVVGEPEEVETQRLLAWARAELARLEGTFHPKRFAAEIRRRELFPDEDPLAPLPDDPDAVGGT